MLTLNDICLQITDGSHFSPEDKGIGYPMLSVKDMRDDHFDLSECKYVDEEDYQKLLANGCKPLLNDVVLAKDGSYLKTAFTIKEEQDIALLSSIAILRPDLNVVIPDYLSYFLKSKPVYRTVSLNYISGTALKRIILKGIKKIPVQLPSLQEQQCRVDLLNFIQNIIKLRKQEIRYLDEIIKARFVELFGDPVQNEKGWRTKPLLEMGNCKNGMNFHYDDCGVEINCLGVGDFKDLSVIDNTELLPTVSLNEMPSEEYLLKDDDIVFVRSNGNKALVGRSVAVYPGDTPTTFSGFCIRYRKYDDVITIPYLLRVLKTDSIRSKMAGRGANIQNLNQQILGTLLIPVPPIELQTEFSNFVNQVDKSKVINTNQKGAFT